MKSIITIGGFMATGKSTIGPLVANILDYQFVDIDEYIQEREGLSITEIFDQKGEVYFRTCEETHIRKMLQQQDIVVSLGGGSLHWQNNYLWIVENSHLFVLLADWTTISERISSYNRPLFNEAKNLYKERAMIYHNSGIAIDVVSKSPQEIAKLIVDKYYE